MPDADAESKHASAGVEALDAADAEEGEGEAGGPPVEREEAQIRGEEVQSACLEQHNAHRFSDREA